MTLSSKIHYALRFRRLGISGSTITAKANLAFCRILGQRLALESGLTLVTGGFHYFNDNPDMPSVAWTVTASAAQELLKEKIALDSRIETLLPGIENPNISRFSMGRVTVLPQKSSQSRRFVWVSSVDLLLTIEGDENTKEMIDLALALQKPCLPLGFTGAKSREMWVANRSTIQDLLNLSQAEIDRLDKTTIAGMTTSEMVELIEFLFTLIRRKLKPTCLIIMPFSDDFQSFYQDVKQAVMDAGLDPIRLDHLNLTGNAISALRNALHSCDYALAVLTRFNPNVMYELGFAHSQNKITVLICETGPDGKLPELPFDIRSESVICYKNDVTALQLAIKESLLHL